MTVSPRRQAAPISRSVERISETQFPETGPSDQSWLMEISYPILHWGFFALFNTLLFVLNRGFFPLGARESPCALRSFRWIVCFLGTSIAWFDRLWQSMFLLFYPCSSLRASTLINTDKDLISLSRGLAFLLSCWYRLHSCFEQLIYQFLTLLENWKIPKISIVSKCHVSMEDEFD